MEERLRLFYSRQAHLHYKYLARECNTPHHDCYAKLDNGSIVLYTEATRGGEPTGNFQDYQELGWGVFDHIEYEEPEYD